MTSIQRWILGSFFIGFSGEFFRKNSESGLNTISS